jgi:hypothetical protein
MGAYNKCIAISGIYGLVASLTVCIVWKFNTLGFGLCMIGLLFSSIASFIGCRSVRAEKEVIGEHIQFKEVGADYGDD